MTSLALACKLNAAQTLPSKVARMVAALRRIGGSLWMVENAFSGAFVDNVGATPVTAYGDLLGRSLDKTGSNHATQSAVASKPSVQRVPKRLGPELLPSTDLTTWVSGGAFDNWAGTTATADTITTTGESGSRRVRLACTPSTAYSFSARVTGGTGLASVAIAFGTSATAYITNKYEASVTSGSVRCVFTAPANAAFVEFIVRGGSTGKTATFADLRAGEVLEWANVISFDGSNDFLQTGITTGNEGFVAAAVTFADANVTFFSSGTTAANAGVWLYRDVGGAKSMNLAVANGSAIAYSPNIIPPTNTPVVVSGGWTATTVFAGVDHTETSTSSRSGASASALPLRLGIATDASYPLNGLKHAAAYAPVLPDAATRKIIRDGIAALQGRTL